MKVQDMTQRYRKFKRAWGTWYAFDKPRPNAVKVFSAIELITLPADPDWLDEVTKTIVQHWRRKNAQRNGLNLE
jgi:hypothetical protein